MAELSPQNRLRILANAYATAENKEPILAEILRIQNSLNKSQSELPSNPSPAMKRQQEIINRRTDGNRNIPNFPPIQVSPQDIAKAQAGLAEYYTGEGGTLSDEVPTVPSASYPANEYNSREKGILAQMAYEGRASNKNPAATKPGTVQNIPAAIAQEPAAQKSSPSFWEDPIGWFGSQTPGNAHLSRDPTVRKMYDFSNWENNNG